MKISVIIPLYNKEHYIKDTIKSVLSQTYTNWEAIIIDDGSTDESAQITQSFCDSRIRFFRQTNQGVSKTRNRGIELSLGDYIAFLDADDKWKPNYLETMLKLTEEYPDYSVFCSAHDGHYIHSLPIGVSIIKDHCKFPFIFWTGCMFIKRSVFKEIGGFREGIQLGEDRDMWLRIACKYPTIYLNKELAYHPYITENNLNRTIDIINSFPYWEWYDYSYPYKKSLYQYTTIRLVSCADTLIKQKRYADAWFFLKKTRGHTTLRPRIKLFFKILLKKS